jgi:hypothetical protein
VRDPSERALEQCLRVQSSPDVQAAFRPQSAASRPRRRRLRSPNPSLSFQPKLANRSGPDPKMAPHSAERNGFTTKIFIIDCSVSMGQLVQDPELDRDPAALQKDRRLEVLGSSGGGKPILRSKLQWAKEYVMRKVFEQVRLKRLDV